MSADILHVVLTAVPSASHEMVQFDQLDLIKQHAGVQVNSYRPRMGMDD